LASDDECYGLTAQFTFGKVRLYCLPFFWLQALIYIGSKVLGRWTFD
jgi:hypothetical protein